MAQFDNPDDLNRQLLAMVRVLVDAATSGVPPPVMASWSAKAEAARAVLDGTADALQQAMIAIEAGKTGENPAHLAARINARATSFTMLVATIEGTRRAFDARIAAAAPDELDAIFAQMVTSFDQLTAML